MKKVGIIMLIIGLSITVFTGLNFVTSERVVEIGQLQINAKRNYSLALSPMVGVIVISIGAGLYLLGNRKSMKA